MGLLAYAQAAPFDFLKGSRFLSEGGRGASSAASYKMGERRYQRGPATIMITVFSRKIN